MAPLRKTHLAVLGCPITNSRSRSAPDVVDKKVDGALETTPSVPHVPRHDTVQDALTIFYAEFEIPLAKVGALLVVLIIAND